MAMRFERKTAERLAADVKDGFGAVAHAEHVVACIKRQIADTEKAIAQIEAL